jgi:hypothetical protein
MVNFSRSKYKEPHRWTLFWECLRDEVSRNQKFWSL